MSSTITKKVPYGRIILETKDRSLHATKGWRKRVNQEKLTNGYNKIMEFLKK